RIVVVAVDLAPAGGLPVVRCKCRVPDRPAIAAEPVTRGKDVGIEGAAPAAPVVAGATQVAQPGRADGTDTRIVAGGLVAAVLLRRGQRFATALGEPDLPVRARPCQRERQGDAG